MVEGVGVLEMNISGLKSVLDEEKGRGMGAEGYGWVWMRENWESYDV